MADWKKPTVPPEERGELVVAVRERGRHAEAIARADRVVELSARRPSSVVARRTGLVARG